MTNKLITFTNAQKKHKDIILKWFNKPHVKQYYYGEGLQNTLNNIELYMNAQNNNGKYMFDHWVALIDNEPFGFLMTSPIAGPHDPNDSYKKWYVDGKTTFTLDLLIGEEECLGKGLSTTMIRSFIIDKFAHADYFLIDPVCNNSKAIHVYKKAGFIKIDDFVPDHDPIPHIMMQVNVKEIINPTIIEINAKETKNYHGSSYTSCVIFNNSKIVLQKRGANFYTFPDCISAFGGKVESNETPLDTIIRELKEELNIEVSEEQLTFVGVVTEKESNYKDLVYQYYLIYQPNIENCFEGELIAFNNIKEVLEQPKVMSDVKWLLNKIEHHKQNI